VGSLILPASGKVYADAQIFIYAVERHLIYGPLVDPLWQAVQAGTLEVIGSELTLMESLVGPIKKSDMATAIAFEQFFLQAGISLLPITPPILREAARLRATTKLRTPDAIQAATAMTAGCALFVTNDFGFRGFTGLPVVILDDLLKP
jgi:predicted nucleic acid-binding protein